MAVFGVFIQQRSSSKTVKMRCIDESNAKELKCPAPVFGAGQSLPNQPGASLLSGAVEEFNAMGWTTVFANHMMALAQQHDSMHLTELIAIWNI